AETGAAMPADRVELVDEYDAGSLLLRLVEHVAHTRCPDTDEHFDEVRTRNGEERHFGLARDGFREQRLARARGPYHQHALGDLSAQPLELARVPEEIHDFSDLGFRLIHARNVGKRNVYLVFAQQPCLALAEGHGAAAAASAL